MNTVTIPAGTVLWHGTTLDYERNPVPDAGRFLSTHRHEAEAYSPSAGWMHKYVAARDLVVLVLNEGEDTSILGLLRYKGKERPVLAEMAAKGLDAVMYGGEAGEGTSRDWDHVITFREGLLTNVGRLSRDDPGYDDDEAFGEHPAPSP